MTVSFLLNGMAFQYDEEKNIANIRKHGISFEIAARVFLDYDRIEMYDDDNSLEEDRYDTIGDISAATRDYTVGHIGKSEDILFVVYTEREQKENTTVTRIISARRATSFERGCIMENIKTINEILTDEEIKQLEEAKKKPIVFDEDCPETTPERAIKFRRVNPPRRILG